MSILWMDNFSNYGTDTDNPLDGLYADFFGELQTDPDGVSPGRVYYRTAASYLRKVLPSTKTTVGMHARLWYASLPDANDNVLYMFMDSTNTGQVSIRANSTGTISAYRGGQSGGTLLGTTTLPALTAGAWYHLEVKVVFDNAVGSVEIRVNEQTVLDLTDIDTQATSTAGCAQVWIGAGPVGNKTSRWKDFIIWDDGGTENNDFMGDWRVITLTENGDVSVPWTKSSGTTGYTLIDENSPNDSDYIQADDTPPGPAEFDLEDLDPEIVSIAGLQTVVRMFKTDAGTAQVQVGLKSNGDIDNGADRAITVAATYYADVSELSPDTGLSWTPNEVDAATLVIDRTV